jgi:hypothetical protein
MGLERRCLASVASRGTVASSKRTIHLCLIKRSALKMLATSNSIVSRTELGIHMYFRDCRSSKFCIPTLIQ